MVVKANPGSAVLGSGAIRAEPIKVDKIDRQTL